MASDASFHASGRPQSRLLFAPLDNCKTLKQINPLAVLARAAYTID